MVRELRTEAELREFVSEPSQAIAEKAIDHVDAESARFLAASPFFLLATTAADGSCDVSPRGDPPGSVLVVDERTLAFGDRKGNRRLDSMTNILQRPRVGMLFLVPGVGDTLRVNGPARIVAEAPYLPRLTVAGVTPQLAIEVRVEELFLHCSKAFARSALWDPASWPAKRDVPTAGQLVRSQHNVPVPAKVIDKMLRRDARFNRY
jgi:PPOX class probable FMN-dependent enzyme